jgi:HEPN domain-containing protein
MARDPALVNEANAWLRRAASDIRAGQFELTASPPLTGDIAFHSQQAIEKALKAFLVLHGEIFRKTHSIEEIGEQCLALDETLRTLVDRAVPLSEYAWKFRYPGDAEEPPILEAEDALAIAVELYEAIRARVQAESTL